MRASFKKSAGALLGVSVMLVASSLPVAAATTPNESFVGFLAVSGASGTRTVVRSLVAASGVFTGVGRIVERDNLPGDPDAVSRDDLVFADGALHLVNVSLDVSVNVDPTTCSYTVKAKQSSRIEGGTGRFRHASGTFAAIVDAHGTGRRAPDGSCSADLAPLSEFDGVTARGTLSI